ncbi:lasso peptide biosynthesis PqqD family chaperone [Streptomyces sp. NPDC057002]|uniref:lasso peptide biosynthesis PqqD family chaperone n=1 Tax=Streptomyces sp. NPDC057002 TaxID=3345992 RepID=UPI00362FC4D8
MAFKLREGVFTAETDYGIALLDEDRDQYWTLNPSAALTLRTLLDGGTEAAAARKLSEEYAVDIGTAQRDVRELVGELRSAGLGEDDSGRGAHGRWPHGRGRRAGRSRR